MSERVDDLIERARENIAAQILPPLNRVDWQGLTDDEAKELVARMNDLSQEYYAEYEKVMKLHAQVMRIIEANSRPDNLGH